MVSEVTGPDSSDKYKSVYNIEGNSLDTWKKFWEQLFHQELSPDEVKKMTDVFVKNVSHDINHVLDHSLKVQKALRRAAETGEAPEPV